MKVMIAEDDEYTREGLSEILQAEGYEVLTASDGELALQLYETESPQFICLDIMMPRIDGYELCRRIRRLNADVPIIFISAKSEEIDKVIGLEIGADDFIVKPFGVKEVVARIRAVTRRCLSLQKAAGAKGPSSFLMVDLEVFPNELRAKRGSEVIELSLRDAKILQMFHEYRGRILDRARLFEHCWGMKFYPNTRTLDQQISQLRKRIESNPQEPRIIRTVHGVGYRFDHDPGA